MKLKLLIIFIVILQYSTPVLANNTEVELANKIVEIVARIVGKEKIGSIVNPKWKDNIEVKDVVTFSDMKRNAIIIQTLDNLKKNEKKIIPKIKSDNDLTVLIILRLKTHEYLTSLISSSENNTIIKNYFNNEISDLKMIVSGKQKYGFMYINPHKTRWEKVQLLMLSDAKFVKEFLLLSEKKPDISQALANKTTLLSLLSICQINKDFCLNL